MTVPATREKLRRLYGRLTGSATEYDTTAYHQTIRTIAQRASVLAAASTDDLDTAARSLRMRAATEPLDNLLVDTYALVFEAVRRSLGVVPFECQLAAAAAMHRGRLAQMQTGEGKTLAAVFPVALAALSGHGVHILTFNDYLARRDAAWMGPVYACLGLSVGCVQEGMGTPERQAAYRCDVTYLTARESGFDYLRDSLCHDTGRCVHRPLNFAVIDEADSILIDESRVPLVIAGADEEFLVHVHEADRAVQALVEQDHFGFDEYRRNVFLTEPGIEYLEERLSCGNLYDTRNAGLLGCVQHALHARHLLARDRDYIVRNGEVQLVDEFTGRVADRRRWPDGLHAAVEAKEHCVVHSRGRILNSIPLQHFLQQYPKLAGMSATALPAERELQECYGLAVTVVEPNRPSQRVDHTDVLFATRTAKLEALMVELLEVHATGRPVLVGTQTVKESVELASALQAHGVPCRVLNARDDEHEAEIVAEAGRMSAVTISTNMAGRGTDIRLGGTDECERGPVVDLGGLYVIGTARYESKRIDNQLRGRAGRQGDPGSSRFFLSLEDDLFQKYRLHELLPPSFRPDGTQAIADRHVMAEVDRVQRIVEGQNTDLKTMLCRYTLVLEQQRAVVQERRTAVLETSHARDLLATHHAQLSSALAARVSDAELAAACRQVALGCIDEHWSHYLAAIADIRDSIHLRRFGGQEPLYEFRKLSLELFSRLLPAAEEDTIAALGRMRLVDGSLDLGDALPSRPSATWTYQVNDDPSEQKFALQLGSSVGLSAWAALLWPFTALLYLVKRLSRLRRTDSARHGSAP